MGWMTGALLLVALTGACALPRKGPDPSEILLSSLTFEQVSWIQRKRVKKKKKTSVIDISVQDSFSFYNYNS